MHHLRHSSLVDTPLKAGYPASRFLISAAAIMVALAGFSARAIETVSVQADQAAADRLLQTVPIAEWMGPLAPVALSPFFGLACLSGASMLMSRGLLPENSLLMGNPALNDGRVLTALVILALFTSLPRLTKVSKPIAQLGDFIETYAGIVILLVIHYVGARVSGTEDAHAGVFLQAGLFSGGGQVIIAILSAINILVIQAVRAFFELLIFLSPVPFLDAFFEMINKAVCLVLISIYVYSATAALVINVIMFLICLAAFRRVHRRTMQFREKVLLPLWRKFRGKPEVEA